MAPKCGKSRDKCRARPVLFILGFDSDADARRFLRAFGKTSLESARKRFSSSRQLFSLFEIYIFSAHVLARCLDARVYSPEASADVSQQDSLQTRTQARSNDPADVYRTIRSLVSRRGQGPPVSQTRDNSPVPWKPWPGFPPFTLSTVVHFFFCTQAMPCGPRAAHARRNAERRKRRQAEATERDENVRRRTSIHGAEVRGRTLSTYRVHHRLLGPPTTFTAG